VDDAVHVEIEVVELDAVGVGEAEVDGNEGAGLELLLLRVGDSQGVAVGQPPVERRDSHLRPTCPVAGSPRCSRSASRGAALLVASRATVVAASSIRSGGRPAGEGGGQEGLRLRWASLCGFRQFCGFFSPIQKKNRMKQRFGIQSLPLIFF
jgi:hypothetical protein